MRTIKAPADVKYKNVNISFKEFVRSNMLADQQFGVNFDTLKLARDIYDAVGNDPIVVDEPAWELMCRVIKQPMKGYEPISALHLFSFFVAILEAK
jgi:hypothetical protein